MTKKATYPSHWQYTTIENLKKFVPPTFTRPHVVIKEFLDNACDAAEKKVADGFVDIKCLDEVVKITNLGAIPAGEFEIITDFSLRISEKYLMKSFIRGQIGHGLKIAIMLVLTDENKVIFESAGYRHTITLKDRSSRDPRKVLDVESREDKVDSSKTTVIVPISDICTERLKVEVYMLKYIALNPQISFRYQYVTYDRTIDIKKSEKVDIFSYSGKEFREFKESYLNCGFKIEEFVKLFNVKKTRLKHILRECNASGGEQSLYLLLKDNSKRLVYPTLTKEGIEERISKVFGGALKVYKKVELNNGFVEIAFFSNDSPIVVSGVNGSCVPPKFINLTSKIWFPSLEEAIRDLKIKDSVFFSYYSTTPNYKGTNKEAINIYQQKVYNALHKLAAKPADKSKQKIWLLKKEEYKTMALTEPTSTKLAKELGLQPYIYHFIKECKSMAKSIVKRFGPITMRQLYYQLVSRQIIKNSANSYTNFKRHMKSARVMGIIEYDIFEDRSRHTIIRHHPSRHTDVESHIRACIKASLTMPRLNIWEDQPYYVEVWIEKDALVGLFSEITKEWQVALFPSRGYTSLTKIEEARKRFKEKIRKGKKVILLYAGDLDPSGWDIYENICNKFSGEDSVKVIRFALNPDQTKGLIAMPVKKSDSRYKPFIEMHPDLKGAYELDAFDPDKLQQLTKKTIDKYFDTTLLPKDAMEKWQERFKNIKGEILRKLEG